MRLSHLDLFSGIGGFALGLEATGGFETVAFCESEPYCRKVLRRHWPGLPIYRDVAHVDRDSARPLGRIDIVTGGFPCQRFSTASRGRANAPDLYPEMSRIIHQLKPSWVVAENVPGIGIDGVDRVCSQLEAENYSCWAFDVDTSLPGRSRGRRRFIWLAYTNGQSESRQPFNAKMARVPKIARPVWRHYPEPMGMADGLPRRMDRLRALGNAIVPQIATVIGQAILEVERNR